MSNDVMKNFTNLVIKSLDEMKDNVFPWIRPWKSLDCEYRNGLTNHKYSGLHNILTIMLEHRNDCRYVTFNQIRKAGGTLKKGSKATHLIAWRLVTKIDSETGKEKVIPFAKDVCVFNVEDTEGLNLPEINNNIINNDVKPNEIVMELIKKYDVKFESGLDKTACYNPLLDKVYLPLAEQFKSSEDWTSTCLHELIHWTAKRVDRNCKNYSFDIEERAMEELVAELGSMMLQMHFKLDGSFDKNNLAYIKSWKDASKGKNGDRFIYKACSLAEKACRYLVPDAFKTHNKVDEKDAA